MSTKDGRVITIDETYARLHRIAGMLETVAYLEFCDVEIPREHRVTLLDSARSKLDHLLDSRRDEMAREAVGQ